PKIAQAGHLEGRVCEGPFIDIGIPEALQAAQTLMPQMMNRPATFLDRDGILNVDKSYVCRREEFVWIEGAKPAVKALNDAGYLVVVVTNQAGVARGFYDEDAVRSLHEWINEELRQEGSHIDAFYYSPHHRDGVLDRYAC